MKALDYAILKRVFEVILAKLNRAVRRTLKMLKRFYPLIQRRLQSKNTFTLDGLSWRLRWH
jgi:hypothetical protein